MMAVQEKYDRLCYLTVYIPNKWFNNGTKMIFEYKPNYLRGSSSDYSWISTTASTHSLSLFGSNVDSSVQSGYYYNHKPNQKEIENGKLKLIANEFDNENENETENDMRLVIVEQLIAEAVSWESCVKSRNIISGLRKCGVVLTNDEIKKFYDSITHDVDTREFINMNEICKLMVVKELELEVSDSSSSESASSSSVSLASSQDYNEKLVGLSIQQLFYIVQSLNVEMKTKSEGNKNWIDPTNVKLDYTYTFFFFLYLICPFCLQ